MLTIPSGIITTQAATIEKIAREIPEIGVLTTKSIGFFPRDGYREPILTQYAPGCFMNAVGLTNPGAEEFARQLQELKLPENRFLLTSIFGKDAEECAAVAKILAPYSDGLELNLSCPHAEGYGMAIGQDPALVRDITAAVKQAVRIPVIPKLTPNVQDIGAIAKAAVEGGADALCAINTVGPGYYTVDGHPVLTNAAGGMSGKGILPLGLNAMRQMSQAVHVPLIGCGGVSQAKDVRAYQQAGASIVGIGSALIGLSSEELKEYFRSIQQDVEQGTTDVVNLPPKATYMTFSPYRLKENRRLTDDLSLLVFDDDIGIFPGQFVFVWIPGVGEKPFSVLDDSPLTLFVKKRGCFTEKLLSLKPDDEVSLRGPYGVPVDVQHFSKIILVSGGCGLAAMYQMARDFQHTDVFLGAKTQEELFYLDEIRQCAGLHVATEDGSLGYTGLVSELLREWLQAQQKTKGVVFFNCGPEAMIHAVLEIEKAYAPPERIYSAIDYVTKCGVGLCGSCASPDGRRLCVDGPFLEETG